MPRASAASVHNKRIFGLFEAHKTVAYRKAEVYHELKDIHTSVIDYWIRKYIEDGSLIQVSRGVVQFNNNPPLSIDEIRERADQIGRERVVDSGRGWSPTEQVIQIAEQPALPSKRLHLRSILQRMTSNPTAFSSSDTEFLEKELRHLLVDDRPLPTRLP